MYPSNSQERGNENDKKTLLNFFIVHLNRIYFAKLHLVERLTEISGDSSFKNVQPALDNTTRDVQAQITRMELIFNLLGDEPDASYCDGLINMIEDNYSMVFFENQAKALQELSLLFYLQTIESVEMSSFKILTVIAENLCVNNLVSILNENYEEAKKDRDLLFLLTKNRLTKKL